MPAAGSRGAGRCGVFGRTRDRARSRWWLSVGADRSAFGSAAAGRQLDVSEQRKRWETHTWRASAFAERCDPARIAAESGADPDHAEHAVGAWREAGAVAVAAADG